MKLFFFVNIIILTVITIAIKLTLINQENEVKILTQKISEIEKEIEKLEIDFSYISSPKKLKEINDKEFRLNPIEQEDWIILENK
jgi:cell division protein FtsL